MTLKTLAPFRRLQEEAIRLGSAIIVEPRKPCFEFIVRGTRNVKPCPFNERLRLVRPHYKSPYSVVVDLVGRYDFSTIIHELGHACVTGDVKRDDLTFLGWEFYLARRVGCLDEWLRDLNNTYITKHSRGIAYKDLTIDQQSDFLEAKCDEARQRGFVWNDIPLRVAP